MGMVLGWERREILGFIEDEYIYSAVGMDLAKQTGLLLEQ
jgi:hypothetical protein